MIFFITICSIAFAHIFVMIGDPARFIRINDLKRNIKRSYKPLDCITCMSFWSGLILCLIFMDYQTTDFWAALASSYIFGRLTDKTLV